MTLTGTKTTINEMASPTWIGVRQKGFETVSTVNVGVKEPVQGMRAGLTAYYNDSYHYEIYLTRELDTWKVSLAKHVHDIFTTTASMENLHSRECYSADHFRQDLIQIFFQHRRRAFYRAWHRTGGRTLHREYKMHDIYRYIYRNVRGERMRGIPGFPSEGAG